MEFKYESKTEPGKFWTTVVERGQAVCDCIGYVNHGKCHHQDDSLAQVKAALGETLMGERSLVAAAAPKHTAIPARPTVRTPHAMMPSRDEIRSMIDLSNALARGAGVMIPKHYDKSEKVFAAAYFGWELGVPVMTVLRHTFVINGRIEPDAQLMMGLVIARDPTAEFRWKVGPDALLGAEVELWLRGNHVSTGKWLPSDAERSGQLKMPRKKVVTGWKPGRNGRDVPEFEMDAQGKYVMVDEPGNWQLWPSDMYAWAAVKRACRFGASHLINAIEGMFSLGATLISESFAVDAANAEEEYGSMGTAGLMELDPFAGQMATPGDDDPPAAPTPGPAPAPQDAPPVASDTPSPTPTPVGDVSPQESAPVQPQGKYLWLDDLQRLRANEFKSVDSKEICAFLEVDPEFVNELDAIEEWIFDHTDKGIDVSYPERTRALLLAVVAARHTNDGGVPDHAQPQFDERFSRTRG